MHLKKLLRAYKTDRHDITEILLNVSLNTITLIPVWMFTEEYQVVISGWL